MQEIFLPKIRKMKKKANLILTIVFALFLCLFLLASCSSSKADYFTYSEANLGLVGKLVRWMHGWIGNYGWTVVVFTLFLKLIMLPLDLWQRVSAKKMTAKTQRMQPLLAEIDRRYGANTQRANEEKQKLYKKEGYSMFSSCLPMIVSMVIFFVMFAGLREYSTYSSVKNFQELSGTYFDAYCEAVKADDSEKYTVLQEEIAKQYDALNLDVPELSEHFLRENYSKDNVNAYLGGINEFLKQYDADETSGYQASALAQVADYYTANHEGWLWLQNVWQPDTWATIMPAYTDNVNGFSSTVDMSEFSNDSGKSHYELIRSAVLQTGERGTSGSWNGLMILPILSVGLSFLSLFLSQKLEKKKSSNGAEQPQTEQQAQQAASNKMMMFLMPAMMAVFGFMYTGAFAIYMVANSCLGIVSTLALKVPSEKIAERSLAKASAKDDSNKKADYMR